MLPAPDAPGDGVTKEAGVAASAPIVSASACMRSIGRGVCATADLGCKTKINSTRLASNNKACIRVVAPCHRRAHQGRHRGSWGADWPSTEELSSRIGRHKARAFKVCTRSRGRRLVQRVRAVQATKRQRVSGCTATHKGSARRRTLRCSAARQLRCRHPARRALRTRSSKTGQAPALCGSAQRQARCGWTFGTRRPARTRLRRLREPARRGT